MRKLILGIAAAMLIVIPILAQIIPNRETRVTLRGRGIPGCDLTVLNGNVDFGDVFIGETASVTFNLRNNSATAICEITGVESTAPQFAVSPLVLPLSLAPSADATGAFDVLYTPSVADVDETGELVLRWKSRKP